MYHLCFAVYLSPPSSHRRAPRSTRPLTDLPPLSFNQTGALPLTSSLSASNAIHNASAQAPFRAPTIFISVLYFSALAYYTYDLGLWVATGPSAVLAVWGVWAVSL